MPTTADIPAPEIVVSPFVLLLLAIPVLVLGEQLVRRIGWLGKRSIPAPIAGGLLVAVVVLIVQKRGVPLRIVDRAPDVPWQWIALPQWNFAPPAGWSTSATAPPNVYAPLLILFFSSIGLNASWNVARRGGLPLLIFLGLAAALAVAQFSLGAATAYAIGASPLLGLMCSGVTLMGGFGTASGSADAFEQAGLHDAKLIGVAAAAFGVIAGGLLAGPIGGALMPTRSDRRDEEAHEESPELSARAGGFFDDLASSNRHIGSIALHLFTLLACVKLGAFLTASIKSHGDDWMSRLLGGTAKFSFPSYLGAMIVAAIVRNLHDALGFRFLDNRRIDLIASIALAWLLSAVMIGLNLANLSALAAPMLAILLVQIVMMAAACYWIVFRVMGRDREAAMMTAGMVGFGIGATSNAVASMRSLATRFGPAPRAFLIVTLVGGFLIDFVDSILITVNLTIFKPR